MGLDLTVGIVDIPQMDRWLIYSRILFERMDFDSITALESQPLPVGKVVAWYKDDGITKIRHDSYGNVLRCLNPLDLFKLDSKMPKTNQLIVGFLRQLPVETTLVLYWH